MASQKQLKNDEKDGELGTRRNILIETFNKIRDDLRRGEHVFKLKVRVVRGRQIQGDNVSPKVRINFKNEKRWTQTDAVCTNNPIYGETFHFICTSDVDSLLRENIKFSVVNSRMFRRNRLIGEFQLSLVLVAGEPAMSMFNRWLALVEPEDAATMCKGFLQVCVALVFPNQTEAIWPSPLHHDEIEEDQESAVLTCSGHAFLNMTFILSVYFMQDIPKFDLKGRRVTEFALGLSYAGKSIMSPPYSMPEQAANEMCQVRKEVRLTACWPSMCNKLTFTLNSIFDNKASPLCSHYFYLDDIAVESSSSLKKNVKSAVQFDAHFDHLETTVEPKNDSNYMKNSELRRKTRSHGTAGFMPKIGPCFVNMYGASLDAFEDKMDAEKIAQMNSGETEGCAYRGRVFVRLQSSLSESENETGVRELVLGAKEERDLQMYSRSSTFLLFGLISAVPMVADVSSPIQFEVAIGHNGVNSMSSITKANIYPSTTFSMNPKELLRTQKKQTGHSYFTSALDSEKPAVLIESTWENICYRIHFYNLVRNLKLQWDNVNNIIIVCLKLGLQYEKAYQAIRDHCTSFQKSRDSTEMPANWSNAAKINEMDTEWKMMRDQQLKDIDGHVHKIIHMVTKKRKKAGDDGSLLINAIEKLNEVSLLLENIAKEPQLSIPDIFVYMLVNNERRAYARIPASEVYHCSNEGIAANPIDRLCSNRNRPNNFYDNRNYIGPKSNQLITLFLKHIPGAKGPWNEPDYWPLPAVVRVQFVFGLTSAIRSYLLPSVKYYGVMYEYKKLNSCLDLSCSPNGQVISFQTDASGVNTLDGSCMLLKNSPTKETEDPTSSWQWVGEWTPWPDKSVSSNSESETEITTVYMVEQRVNSPTWKFVGYYTEDMHFIPTGKEKLDDNYALDTSKWVVVKGNNDKLGALVAWVEVGESKEYCKDIRFNPQDVTANFRLESKFSRTKLQRQCMRRDEVYTEVLRIHYEKIGEKYVIKQITRFDGEQEAIKFSKEEIDKTRSWSDLQKLPPMSVKVTINPPSGDKRNEDVVNPAGEAPMENRKMTKTFQWIDNWKEPVSPVLIEEKKIGVTYERRKILHTVTSSQSSTGDSCNWKCEEYSHSLTSGIFHLTAKKSDRLKRCRMRRLIQPKQPSLNLLSTDRNEKVQLAPFPSFSVRRRVEKRSRICCLFNNLEEIPTPVTVTAVVDTQKCSYWEMQCYLHEARDLVTSDSNQRLEVYAIVTVAGISAPSSIIKNDVNSQLWLWKETLFLRNLIFHEEAKQVEASPPYVIIEIFHKLPIENDKFLGRCIIESGNYRVQREDKVYSKTDNNVAMQWYQVDIKDSEEPGSILIGFHLRHRDTFRPEAEDFKKWVLTPEIKKMHTLVKEDRAVRDNLVRFEIPPDIQPRYVPHILKITCWGLRELRGHMLSRVTSPIIEFRIGHVVIETEKVFVETCPNFSRMSHCMLLMLPQEKSYLPELIVTARDLRSFGRAPRTGVAKLPLRVCRSSEQLVELKSEEIKFFIQHLTEDCKIDPDVWHSEDRRAPLRLDLSNEFSYLFKPPKSLPEKLDSMSVDITNRNQIGSKDAFTRLKSILSSFSAAGQGDTDTPLVSLPSDRSNFSQVGGEERLSKTKPDWWCKYFHSKFHQTDKAITYLEGDRLEYYKTPLEEAVVSIGDLSEESEKTSINSSITGSQEGEDFSRRSTTASSEADNHVMYRGFTDTIEEICLNRRNPLTSVEEDKRFGVFLGKIRLYFVGPLEHDAKAKIQKLKELQKIADGKLHKFPLFNIATPSLANQECIVRVYVVRALDLQAGNYSSLPNSYVEVFIADNKNEIQMHNNKASTVEMDDNPVYGCMFELYAVIPFNTRIKVRVMDKSTFLSDDEIGSTEIDLEKRLTTVYRATCGLPQCYRIGGVNAWRDVRKPSEILTEVCRRFGLAKPVFKQVNAPLDSGATDGQNILHRCHIFPPGVRPRDLSGSERRGRSSQSDGAAESIGHQPPVPDDLPTGGAVSEMLKKRSSLDAQPGQELYDTPREQVVFRLEDFEQRGDSDASNLQPSDKEPEVCRQRLALHILRRLPLVREHVETRRLFSPMHPDMSQGCLEMWLDIFVLSDQQKKHEKKKLKAKEVISKMSHLLPPPVDITPRQPQPYELRVVMWSVHEIISRTASKDDNAGDLYVRAWMEGLGDTQETDVHHNALEGEAEFNWRFVFKLDYLPHQRTICNKKSSIFNRNLTKVPPMLHMQLWNNKRFGFNDFVGSIELDLSKLTSPSRSRDQCTLRNRWHMDCRPHKSVRRQDSETVNLFDVQRVYGYWPLSVCRSQPVGEAKPGAWMVGKVLMELEILSKEEAALKPAGLGRGEPNENPKLPEPRRVGINSSFWSAPLSAFRRFVWPKYGWHLIGLVTCIGFIVVLLCVTVYMPLQTLTSAGSLPQLPGS